MEYSRNITFPIAPGWAFVETKDWRKDVRRKWSGYGGDLGQRSLFSCFQKLSIFCKLIKYFFRWLTNDVWLGPRPGRGNVTRH